MYDQKVFVGALLVFHRTERGENEVSDKKRYWPLTCQTRPEAV